MEIGEIDPKWFLNHDSPHLTRSNQVRTRGALSRSEWQQYCGRTSRHSRSAVTRSFHSLSAGVSISGHPSVFITDKCNLRAVRRPRSTLIFPVTKQLREHMHRFVAHRHQVQFHILVRRMPGDIFSIGKKHHPFAVGRNVREPVVVSSIMTCSWLVPSACMRQICMCPDRSELK